MKNIVLGSIAALCLLTPPALADGYRRPAPAYGAPVVQQAPPSWSGFYLGAGIGAGAVVHDVDFGVAGVGNVASEARGRLARRPRGIVRTVRWLSTKPTAPLRRVPDRPAGQGRPVA